MNAVEQERQSARVGVLLIAFIGSTQILATDEVVGVWLLIGALGLSGSWVHRQWRSRTNQTDTTEREFR